MSDSFGNQTSPFPPTESGKPAGDSALGHLGEYLQVVVNDSCSQIWDSEVCPGRKAIEHLFYHDPKKLFDDLRLPALYLWRGKEKRSRKADDLYLKTSTIEIAWIAEGAQEETAMARDPAMNAIKDAIDSAVDADRSPLWIRPETTDDLSVLQGSSVSDACGFSRCQPGDTAPQEFVFQRIEDSAALPYYGFTMTIEADEYYSPASSSRKPPKLNATLATNGSAPVPIITDVP